MNEKIILLTGATSGIGKYAAFCLAKAGHRLVLTARSREKAEQLTKEIQIAAPGASAEYLEADLSEISQVENLIKEIRQKYLHIDVIINNAAVFPQKRCENSRGIELQFMVNYLAPRLLTMGILNLLGKSPAGRIVNVSSRLHRGGRLNFSDLQMRKRYSAMRAYANTKLLFTAFTMRLAQKLEKSTITVLALHPGVYATGLTRELPQPAKFLWNAVMPSPEKGGKIICKMALDDTLRGENGAYFDRLKKGKALPAAYDEKLQGELEKFTLAILDGKIL